MGSAFSFAPAMGTNRTLGVVSAGYDEASTADTLTMLNRHLLALSIATVLVSGPSIAAVVCEFEPTLDMADCSRCFKSNPDGASLFLGGKRAASSTDSYRFHQVRVGSIVYQRGVEKAIYSQRNGREKLFEVCYGSAPEIQGASIVLDMAPGSAIQEFELRVERGLPAPEYEFALIGAPDPAEGYVGLFGKTLVFSPSSKWTGKTLLSYSVSGPEGRASTGTITIRRQQEAVTDEIPVLSVEALDYQLAELQASLKDLQLQLEVEEQIGTESLEQIGALEAEIEIRSKAVAFLDQRIAEAEAEILLWRAANRVARLERLFGVSLSSGPVALERVYLAVPALPRSPLWFPLTPPAPLSQDAFLVPYFNAPVQYRRYFALQHPGISDKGRNRRRRIEHELKSPTRRRLTKRDKKLAKRARKKMAGLRRP